MNLKILLAPIAFPVELAHSLIRGYECGFGNWTLDRQPGDPKGCPLEDRKTAAQRYEARIEEQRRRAKP